MSLEVNSDNGLIVEGCLYSFFDFLRQLLVNFDCPNDIF
jgi:hypothetical protein